MQLWEEKRAKLECHNNSNNNYPVNKKKQDTIQKVINFLIITIITKMALSRVICKKKQRLKWPTKFTWIPRKCTFLIILNKNFQKFSGEPQTSPRIGRGTPSPHPHISPPRGLRTLAAVSRQLISWTLAVLATVKKISAKILDSDRQP